MAARLGAARSRCGAVWCGVVLARVVQVAAGGAEIVVLQVGCAQDLSGDGQVDGADLARLVSAWSDTGADLPADLHGDGVVDGLDLAAMLEAWGACGN